MACQRSYCQTGGNLYVVIVVCEVSWLMGLHKVSTTAYHPQTDGLVEHFN